MTYSNDNQPPEFWGWKEALKMYLIGLCMLAVIVPVLYFSLHAI